MRFGISALRLKFQAHKSSFKAKKAEYLVKYGSSFILVHELLGISSYIIVYSLVSSGFIDSQKFFSTIKSVIPKLPFEVSLPETKSTGSSELVGTALEDQKSSRLLNFGATVAIVKTLDVMGLVPLRYLLTFTFAPKVARRIGPHIDKTFGAIRAFVSRKSK